MSVWSLGSDRSSDYCGDHSFKQFLQGCGNCGGLCRSLAFDEQAISALELLPDRTDLPTLQNALVSWCSDCQTLNRRSRLMDGEFRSIDACPSALQHSTIAVVYTVSEMLQPLSTAMHAVFRCDACAHSHKIDIAAMKHANFLDWPISLVNITHKEDLFVHRNRGASSKVTPCLQADGQDHPASHLAGHGLPAAVEPRLVVGRRKASSLVARRRRRGGRQQRSQLGGDEGRRRPLQAALGLQAGGGAALQVNSLFVVHSLMHTP